jgi:glutamate synthase domain-containing protein 3
MLGKHGGDMMGEEEITIDALDPETRKPMRYWDLNEKVHNAADNGCKHIILKNVLGQRFIADAMEHKDLKIDIYGTPGNDLGVFMDGPVIEVHGNCEDQTGNTMNSGKIIVHGDAWDVTGLAARGGTILVKGNGGYRIGIHMKEYQEHRPIIVYGGCAKEFFGEYMAGGILVALGLEFKNGNVKDSEIKNIVRGNLGTGIHGGAIYVRGDVPENYLGVGAMLQPFSEEDRKALTPIFEDFCSYFSFPIDKIWEKDINKIAPASSRPYGGYYNPKTV